MEGEKSIFRPISKSNIKTCNEMKKISKKNKIEDKQAFSVIAAKPTDLHEAFPYPITSLPLSTASPDHS